MINIYLNRMSFIIHFYKLFPSTNEKRLSKIISRLLQSFFTFLPFQLISFSTASHSFVLILKFACNFFSNIYLFVHLFLHHFQSHIIFFFSFYKCEYLIFSTFTLISSYIANKVKSSAQANTVLQYYSTPSAISLNRF